MRLNLPKAITLTLMTTLFGICVGISQELYYLLTLFINIFHSFELH